MRLAAYSDKKLVVEILTSAFSPIHEDNSINLVVKQDKNRVTRIKVLMAYLFERAYMFGEVYISDNEQCCLLLQFSHKEKTTIKTILLDIELAIKAIGLSRVYGVLKRKSIAYNSFPKEPHIKPVILGVKNESINKGTGARIIIEVKQKYGKPHLPVIIDTATMANVNLYKKFGFKVYHTDHTFSFPIYFLRMDS